MASQTFLDLVNGVISETKVTLDPLTAGNFTSPPRTSMYQRFKNWVNMGYHELLNKRKEWYFRSERATVDIWPRIHVSGLDVAFTPAVGDVLVGQSSGVQLTVQAVHTFEDIENDNVNEFTLSVLPVDGYDLTNLILKENFNRTSPTTFTNACFLKGTGQYSFNDLITNLESIDLNHVRVENIPADAMTNGLTMMTNERPLIPVAWEEWANTIASCNYVGWLADMPIYISRTPQGKYELYPQPDGHRLLSFNFTSKLATMVAATDTPSLIPEHLQDYLMWRAVQEYADFDQQAKLYMRATKHVEEYLYLFHRDQLQPPRFDTSRFRV